MAMIYCEGHRGCKKLYPENTLLSYRKAIEMGVDAVEFDVWLSADGVPVIMHDENAYRTCGVDRKLTEMTYDEIRKLDPCCASEFGDRFRGQHVPTLREILELVNELRPDGTFRLGVEIKHYTEQTVDVTVALLKEYGIFERCWFYAFNGRIIRYLKTEYNARTMAYPDFLMQEFDGYDCYDELGIRLSIAKSELMPFYKSKGLPIHIYCADTEEDVRFCIEQGAMLITANDPRPLLKIVKGI
ncbi:MAG: glycerophosphodiester phosphodiesterase [Oscillospiraceae bacterium]|nr:glycerophosphodiester phosphodiesterase [Oscillospiraceae bacterium]